MIATAPARTAFLVALLGLASASAAQTSKAPNGCVVCHGAEGKQFSEGVHALVGITCTDCHGGDPIPLEQEAAHGPALRRLRDARRAVAQCASCHADVQRMQSWGVRTDQLSLYETSHHGKRLAEDPNAPVATCVTCHGPHAIYRPTDPRSAVHKFNQPATCGRCHGDEAAMEEANLDAGVVAEYRSSVHGKALLGESRLSSPACSDCHGSHGATPPGVEQVGHVCGQCHSVVEKFFEESPHMAAATEGSIEECVSCHGAHAVAEPSATMLVGPGPGHCVTCHRDAQDRGQIVAGLLFEGLSGFDASIRQAEESVREAGSGGVFMEREHGYLDDARSLRARARAMTHTLSPERLTDLLSRGHGMVEQTRESLRVRQRTQRDRRIFAGIFLGVTLLLAGILQVYRSEVFGSMRRIASGSGRGRG